MPLSQLEKKWTGMTFPIAAEEMRRLKGEPSEKEKMVLYGLYKQAIHGDIPSIADYQCDIIFVAKPMDGLAVMKYNAWSGQKGKSSEKCKEEYLHFAEKMIQQYGRTIVRCKWNSEVWTVDY